MRPFRQVLLIMLLFLMLPASLFAGGVDEAGKHGMVFTLWPFVDYRESPAEGYRNLSLLGPLFKFQQRGEDQDLALRPIFYRSENRINESVSTEYLYPIATTDSSADLQTVQVLKLFQKTDYRKNDPDQRSQGTMLFPFYISGTSEKYGPYRSFFPVYGDIYERFWRDEYHYVLFPLYGRTVKKGTTTRNYLYPFFATIDGEKESGFQFWPLYGQSAKEGVYRKKFVLWPFYLKEETGLDTDNPTRKLYLLPFYASTDSPKRTSRSYFWPFFGYTDDRGKNEQERDYFWPFILTVKGERKDVRRYLPFYAEEKKNDDLKQWYMWPFYSHEELNSEHFHQEKDRFLYFLYSDNRESWPKTKGERRRMATWPLFLYSKNERGVKSFSFPALLEPIVNREGIERSWAPLWRIYVQKWNDDGDSAASFLWNLYWHESRGNDLAYELFPLMSYRAEHDAVNLKILKGLVSYSRDNEVKKINLLWLPFGLEWHAKSPERDAVVTQPSRSAQ